MSSSSRILYRRVVTTPLSLDACKHPSQPQPPPTSQLLPTEIKGVIFDMDGTLTLPVLNFVEMRLQLGLGPNQDILPTVQSFPVLERAKAMRIIEEFEEEGAKKMQMQPGVLQLLHFIAEKGVKRAIMTRNSLKATQSFLHLLNMNLSSCKDQYPCLQEGTIFSEVITREYEPCKPHPSAVLYVCKKWEVSPDEVAIVGDDKTDMLCGLRAGTAFNILLKNVRNDQQKDFSNFKVDSLSDIMVLFSSPLDVVPRQEEDS